MHAQCQAGKQVPPRGLAWDPRCSAVLIRCLTACREPARPPIDSWVRRGVPPESPECMLSLGSKDCVLLCRLGCLLVPAAPNACRSAKASSAAGGLL